MLDMPYCGQKVLQYIFCCIFILSILFTNIIIFFKPSMSLQFTLLRNALQPLFKLNNSPLVYANRQESILPQLREALKISLGRFTMNELQKKRQVEKKTLQLNKAFKIQTEVIQILSSQDQNQHQDFETIQSKKTTEKNKKSNVKEIQERTDMSKEDHLEFQREESKKILHSASKTVDKTRLIRKQQKSNRVHLKLRKHKFSKIQQNLDLTETVDLKFSPISAHELGRKLQGLLQRKVDDWEQSLRAGKERREIRMLKN